MRRAWDWFWGLGGGRQALVVLALAALVGLLSLLITSTVLLWWPLVSKGDQQGASPEPPAAEHTEDIYMTQPPPEDMDLEITHARWEGERVVVEGRWGGEVSSVYCDLFEGEEPNAHVTDWWERELPARMSWSERTFTQVFVEAREREVEDLPDPNKSYWVLCSGNFSGAYGMQPAAQVEGSPPPR